MLFSKSLLAFAGLAAVGQAQTISLPTSVLPTSVVNSIISRLESDLSTLYSGQNTVPVSLATAVETALATVTADIGVYEVNDWYLTDRVSAINAIITGTPTWLEGLPSDVQKYIKSLATQEAAIFNRDINAGVRADAVIKAGIAVVVGAAVGVVVML